MSKLKTQILVLFCLLLTSFASSTHAVVIDVTFFDSKEPRLDALITEIGSVNDRVYTLDLINGEVIFGDGQQGARPPAGQDNVVASYRHGSGGTGHIVKIYPIQPSNLPQLIPIADFGDTNSNEDLSFIIAGLTSLEFEFTKEGLSITEAQIGSTGIPEPATLVLMGLGLAGIGFARKKKETGVGDKRLSFSTRPLSTLVAKNQIQ
jgi:hypothetical protein